MTTRPRRPAVAPAAVRRNLRAGLKLLDQGYGGAGLADDTIDWAKRLARGEAITKQKATKMRGWLARHGPPAVVGFQKCAANSRSRWHFFQKSLARRGCARCRQMWAIFTPPRRSAHVAVPRDAEAVAERPPSTCSALHPAARGLSALRTPESSG